MSSRKLFLLGASALITASLAIQACKKNNNETTVAGYPAVQAAFGDNINLNNLENYAGQTIPAYITKDNSGSNPVTNAGATLGRVLFYDKALSANNNIACGSCHKQSMAFGDDAIQSTGVNGPTTRHSMRLVNARFAQEVAFFWDKRATTLENQTTQPIQNHNEMGFSGANGDRDINFLIARLQNIGYYKELFKFVYGDSVVTQTRMQNAIAQFIRSIQSFDSKFDDGMALTKNQTVDFPNFTAQENLGKQLFLAPPAPGGGGGFGCQGCHRAPEFDIDPNSRNNGIITVAGSTTAIDITNTNPPSLRNLLNASGQVNGLYMHDGSINNLSAVIDHYAHIVAEPANTNLDPKLLPGGRPQVLNVSQQQKDAIIAFLATLSGKDVYTNKKWASPFR
ncbi:cytochrome-c peroxidase [Mucilaginibacter sp. PPCGB 2223]|uniref:cytochrome-c peroxidase n=1 Tax=Mucilaginibacter sp. PPCGB 2223 TaxID=1886027 RepID=UPI00082530BD|nr:cytochrome c peroxidase [Mucilaginibacter sp. PPCGB 2223]OCX51030.1 cytochrome-c peroxidase [Mucilaginibacter sp. PPCGB 2223]